MRNLIAILTLLAVALPVSATECGTADIGWVGTSPKLVRSNVADSVRYDIVGAFVWVQISDSETSSVEVPHRAVGLTVCPDGVTFDLAAEPVERQRHPSQNIVDVDAATWRDHIAQHGGVYPI